MLLPFLIVGGLGLVLLVISLVPIVFYLVRTFRNREI